MVKMEPKENTLALNIRMAEAKASYDAYSKQLISYKPILAWIMKYTMEEYQNLDVEEIAAKYIEGEPEISEVSVHPNETNALRIGGANTEDKSINEGTVYYDVRFHSIAPSTGERVRLIINVEAQREFWPGYPLVKRGVYYGSRMISAQYGTVFTKAHYNKLRKVYSVWICLSPPKKWQNTITAYQFQEKNVLGEAHEVQENYDLINVIIVGLTVPEGAKDGSLIQMLSVLLSDEMSAKEKQKILQENCNISMTEIGEKEESRMNFGDWIEEKGIQKGIQHERFCQVQKKIQRGKALAQIADEMEATEENIAPYYQLVKENPDCTAEELVKMMQ